MRSTSVLTASAAIAAVAPLVAADLDPNLRRSFWGLAYASEGVRLPYCGATQEEVTTDILQVAQLTPRIKAYGSDCNQTALIMQAIQDTNVDLTVWPTIYLNAPFNQTVLERQWEAVKDAFETYGVEHIGGLSVGNEFLLNSYGDGGSPTDPDGVQGRQDLLEAIQWVNSSIQDMGLDKHIPIGTADAGSAITEELCEGVDYFMGNDHPWFGDVPLDIAAGWTWEFFEENDVAVCEGTDTAMYIGETGWPTSDGGEDETSGGDEASRPNLNTFINDYVCAANNNGSEYFYFSFKDALWTEEEFGGVEPHWGIFYSNNTLKEGIEIPDCLVDSPTGGTVEQSVLADADTSDPAEIAARGSGRGSDSGSGSGSSSDSDDSGALRSGLNSIVGVAVAAALMGLVAA